MGSSFKPAFRKNAKEKEVKKKEAGSLISTVERKVGNSSDGSVYKSITELWEKELLTLGEDESKSLERWHNQGAKYWENDKIPATVDGVLGGYGHVSNDDTAESTKFLLNISKRRPSFKFMSTVDCGSGIGRVAQNLLVPLFEKIDIVEQSFKLISEAKKNLESNSKMGVFYCEGLQTWNPEINKYDLVWIQWCLGHLPDAELIELLKRCKLSLKEGGIICIKENDCTSMNVAFIMDKEDTSITRSQDYFKGIFKLAGLKLVCNPVKQVKFPPELFKVYMYCLE